MDKEYLLKKWLNDDLTEEERIAFEHLDDTALHKAILEHAPLFKASNFSSPRSLHEIEAQALAPKNTPVRSLSWKRSLLQIASVLVIGFAVYFAFFYDQLTTVQTLAAEKTVISLPDNSSVVLNAASAISYRKKNWDEQRTLKLEGEAFFKVAEGHKFDVVTSEGVVTVLGTQFNVKQRDSYFEVTCYEGIVKVTANGNSKKLVAGDMFRLDSGILFESSISDTGPQWTENMSTFKTVPFSRVIAELERQYNITITYTGDKRMQLFSGGFSHNNLENALQSITSPLGLKYQMDGSTNVILFQ